MTQQDKDISMLKTALSDLRKLAKQTADDCYGVMPKEREPIILEALQAVQNAEREKAIPEGWQLVPKEPTDDQCKKLCFAMNAVSSNFLDEWKAALASAPAYEASKGE